MKELRVSGERERFTDVAPTLYVHAESRRIIENIEQIQEDLWTWWAEADLRPSPIRLFVRNNHLEDKYGNDLVLQAKAAGIIRKGRVEEERVDSEVDGVTRLSQLLTERDGAIYISPPGNESEGFGAEGRRRLSFTYIYHKGNGGRIHFLAVPELEKSAYDHLELIADLVEQDLEGEINDRSLVAHPFAIADEKSLDVLAQRLGYQNLLDLWKQALEAKRLRGRAGNLIKHVSERIWGAYQNREKGQLEVLGDVFRGVVALLVSNGLADVSEIDEYFDRKAEAMMGACGVDDLGGVTGVLYQPYVEQMQEFYWRMRNNEQAMEIMQGGSCPGDKGIGFGEEVWNRRDERSASNNVMLDVLGLPDRESREQSEKMECVTCPFCKKTVDAIVTPTQIECPECHEKVSKG